MDDSKQRDIKVFRWHLLLTGVAATLAFGIVIALSLFMPLVMQLQRGELDSASTAGFAEYFLYLHGAFWPVLLCSLASSVATALLLYGRMTEPLSRFIQSYAAVARGECPEDIQIRKIDYVSLESAALNRMLAALRERSSERALGVTEIGEIADELAESAGNVDAAVRLRAALKALD